MGGCVSNNNAKNAIKKEAAVQQQKHLPAAGDHFANGEIKPNTEKLKEQAMDAAKEEGVEAVKEKAMEAVQEKAAEVHPEAEKKVEAMAEHIPDPMANKEEEAPAAPAQVENETPAPAQEAQPTAPAITYKDDYTGTPAAHLKGGDFLVHIPAHGPLGAMFLEEKYAAISDIADQLGVGDSVTEKPGEPRSVREAVQGVVFASHDNPKNYLIETARFYTIFHDDKPIYTNPHWDCKNVQIFARHGHYFFHDFEKKAITRTPINCTSAEQDQQIVWQDTDMKHKGVQGGGIGTEIFDINQKGDLILVNKEEPLGEPFIIKLNPDGTSGGAIYLDDGDRFEQAQHIKFINDTHFAVIEEMTHISILKVDVAEGKISFAHRKINIGVEDGNLLMRLTVCPKHRFLVAQTVCFGNGSAAKALTFLDTEGGKCDVFATIDLIDKKHSMFGNMRFYGYDETGNTLILVCPENNKNPGWTEQDDLQIGHISLNVAERKLEYLDACKAALPLNAFNPNMARIGDVMILTGHNYGTTFALQYSV